MGCVGRSLLFLSLVFFSLPMESFIYEFVVLRRWNGALGNYQYFVGLGDFHDKKHKANRVQMRHLDKVLTSIPVLNTKIGAEDISSPGSNCDGTCGRFHVVSKGGVLGGFAKKCRNLGFETQNFEYRFCRVATLGPVLNNLKANMRQFPSVRETLVGILIGEIERVLKEISSYQDSPHLAVLYAHSTNKIRNEMQALRLHEFAHVSIADYLEAVTTPATRLPYLKRLLTFDSEIFDLKMLHAAHGLQGKASFFAIAGGSHIIRVAELLEKIGWEFMHGTNPKFMREHNLNKCLGGNIIEGHYCTRPKPIDIKIIKNYL